MPCVNVSRNPEFDINDWLDFSEANGTVWAVLIALIDNILAPIRGCTKKGIGVLGPLAERVAARIYSDFELICKKTSDILDDVNKFEIEQFSHDLPVYVTENTVNSSAWVLAGVSKNVIMPIQPAQIGVATNSGEWILINTKSDTGALQRQTSVVDIVLNFLAWYQKQTKINLTATDSVSSVIGAVHTWITDTVGRDCTKLFDYVNSIITDYSVMSPGKRFVVMLYQMLKAGYLASKRSNNLDTITTTHTIILTEDDSRVYVSKRKLLTTSKQICVMYARVSKPTTIFSVGLGTRLNNRSSDHTRPRGKNIMKKTVVRKTTSPPWSTIGFRAWSEISKNQETTLANFVRYPKIKNRAKIPAITKRRI
jgi:hypothetical protein